MKSKLRINHLPFATLA